MAVDFGSLPYHDLTTRTLQLAPLPVDLPCNWNRPRVQPQPALPVGLVRTRLNCAARAASVSLPQLDSEISLPRLEALFLSHVLCFYKMRGAQAFRITHGTTSETCRACC
jgi:hypothetical protein